MYEFNLYTESGDNYCRVQYKNHILIFRHNGLSENSKVSFHVRRIRGVSDFKERRYDNRIDVFSIENGKEVYRTNFNWINCRNEDDFTKECENFFYNWFQINYNSKKSKSQSTEIIYNLPHFKSFLLEPIKEFYEDKEHESLYLTWRDYTLLFVPIAANFETERIDVFQIIEDNYLVHRSNFEMQNIQGKDDFIGTCKKYFRIWCETNEKLNSFDNPIFNRFPWKVSPIENGWWEFDKFPDLVVLTPRTLRDETMHPLIYPFLKWKKEQGYKVNYHFPSSEELIKNSPS